MAPGVSPGWPRQLTDPDRFGPIRRLDAAFPFSKRFRPARRQEPFSRRRM